MTKHPFFKDQDVDLHEFELHWKSLETMYSLAPINVAIHKHSVVIPTFGEATVRGSILPEIFHAGDAMHGSTFFKMLDDAAWFASQSAFTGNFIVTTSFTTYIMKPVTQFHKDKGLELTAKGRIISASSQMVVAESELFCGSTLVAKGSGTFMFSSAKLKQMPRYNHYSSNTLTSKL